SRRRHTRFSRDWSSDVCSSDLKIQPLILSIAPDSDLSDPTAVKQRIEPLFEEYRALYTNYYEACKRPNSPAMRDPNPVIILYPEIGRASCRESGEMREYVERDK